MVFEQGRQISTASKVPCLQRHWAFSRLHLVPRIGYEAMQYLRRNRASTRPNQSGQSNGVCVLQLLRRSDTLPVQMQHLRWERSRHLLTGRK